MTEGRRYWAFISYSHADEAWAKWLHRSVETYRVPRHLVGRALGDEKVPRRLFPVFRDRDELPSSHQLGEVIDRALADSRNLIVICSPRSATSRWVNEEIKAFHALGRSNRVFCLIVDGEPLAAPGSAAACFPPALREHGSEPIAADARAGTDGKAVARLKLIAGLIDLGYDELKQREKRRQWRNRLLGGALAASLVAAAVAGQQAFQQREDARVLEARIEKLYDAGRRELLNHHESRAAVYLTEALALGRDTPALRFMLGQAMRPIDAQFGPVLQAGGAVRRPVFSVDGRRFLTPVQQAEGPSRAQVWDAAEGRPLARLEGLPRSPLITRFLNQEEVLVSGFEEEDLTRSRGSGAFTGIWSGAGGAPRLRFAGHAGRFGQPIDDARRWLVTADAADARGARVWSLADSRLVRTFDAGQRVLTASISPDGMRVVTGDDAGVVLLWDRATGRRKSLSGALPHHVVGALFSRDGQRVLAVGRKGDVRVWSVREGALELAFGADPNGIADLALSDDGRTLVTAGGAGFKVWDLYRGMLRFAHGRELTQWSSVVLSPNAAFAVASENAQSAAEVLDIGGRALELRLEQTGPASAAAFSPDGRTLLTATEGGEIRLWSVATLAGYRLNHERSEDADVPVLAAHFDPRGERLLTAAHDGSVRLWSREGARPLVRLEEGGKLQDATFSPDGTRIASLTAQGALRLRDAATLEPLATLAVSALWNPFGALKFSPDSRRFVALPDAAAAQEPRLTMWNSVDGSVAATLELGCVPVAAAFGSDGGTLVTGCNNGSVHLWDATHASLLAKFSGLSAYVRGLALDRDGSVTAFADGDPHVRRWDRRGAALAGAKAPAQRAVHAIAVSGGEMSLALDSGHVVVTRADDSTRTFGESAPVNALRYLEDGMLLAYRADGAVRVWDTVRGELLANIARHTNVVWNAEVSADHVWLLSSGLDGRVALARIAPEARNAGTLQALLRCRAPWALVDDALAIADPANCDGVRAE